MNGETIIDSALGYPDEFHQLLAEGYLTLNEVKKWFENKFITEQQYKFAVNYLKGE